MSTESEQTLEIPDMAGRQCILQEYQYIAVVGFPSHATSQHFSGLLHSPWEDGYSKTLP